MRVRSHAAEPAAALYQQALEMLAAIRAKAATVKALDALIERGNRLLDEMNSGRSQEKAAA